MLDLKEISYQPQTGERKIIDNLNLKVYESWKYKLLKIFNE